MSVRVRFAPSPTGNLHIGSLRTALYNYLYAKKHKGTLILRIEDTDQTRFIEGAMDSQMADLHWAGIEFDEDVVKGGNFGPYVQSKRTELYRAHSMLLIESGAAYFAFDTAEEIDAMRERQQQAGIAPKYDRSSMRNQYTLGEEETARLLAEDAPRVVRLKVPLTREIHFRDAIRGEVVVIGRDVDDQILLKSDGFPTYHLANVVDDHFMEITHVIRGEEWLPSTPKHILLYEGFGWTPPVFAHLPLLLNPDRSKMSKRYGDVLVKDFRDRGFLPQAMVNFVALLGWNPSGEREIFTIDELIEGFELEKVNKAGAVFDFKKLEWVNGEYLKSTDPLYLADQLLPIAERHGVSTSRDYLAKVIHLVRERITLLNETLTFADYMFGDVKYDDDDYKSKQWNSDTAVFVPSLIEAIRNATDFSHDTLNSAVKTVATERGLKMGQCIHPLRLMITGKSVGAGIFETMELLGSEKTISRCDLFVANNPL